ncbi:MAG: hypothetical protein KJ704_03050, partial [Proteobacteria bacterium]|nr:hypothetical protein [Pseudomonadota bacterium]
MAEQEIRPDHIFYRNLTKAYPTALRGDGIYIQDDDGKTYLDGSGGPLSILVFSRRKLQTRSPG